MTTLLPQLYTQTYQTQTPVNNNGFLFNNSSMQENTNNYPGVFNRNSLPHFNPLSFPPPLPPPTPFLPRSVTPGPSPHFPPLSFQNSPPYVGDYHGAVCSSFQLNKQNDGYQT